MKNLWTILKLAIGLTMALVVLFMAFAVWSVESHPVPKHKIAKLAEGMDSAQVQEILGRPSKVHKMDTGGFTWIYGSDSQWYFFVIQFSASSNVVSFTEDD